MRRKIFLSAAGLLTLLTAILVWRMDIPHWRRLDLNLLKRPDTATQVFDASGNAAGTLDGSKPGRWTPLPEVPAHVRLAFIAAEDLRFYRHRGVDVYRLFGALWHDIRTMSYSQGASTITQQLIKLTHLSQTKTLSRKAQEVFLALQLERRLTKRQILEAYLNAVYFGHGAYGIESASRVYFGKTSEQLSLAEGALLAGIIKSPSRYAPHLNGEKSVARRNSILNTMQENGFISKEECAAAQAEELILAGETPSDARYAWYMDAVLSEAQGLMNLSADEVISGGYRITTGLNPKMQDVAEELFADADRFPANAGDGTPVQGALAALDAQNGEIRALVGGRSYDVRRGLNRATQAQRQPGSAFKPVSTYAAAIDAYGYLPTSIIQDTPRTFPGDYRPRNAGGKSYGAVTLREALSRSLNIATVDLAETVGTPAIRTYAARFGLPLAPQDTNLSMALGSLTNGVSPARLGAAYCALANGGTRVDAHLIRSIEDGDGNVLYRAPQPQDRAASAATAYMVTDMLKTAAKSGSARALASCGMPVAAKTGTVAEGDAGTRDIWTVAYTPDAAVAVWMGFDQPDAEHAMPSSAGGSGYPAQMCAAFLRSVSDTLSGRDFHRPKGVRTALLDLVALDDERAVLLSTERTPAGFTTLELFHDYDMPTDFSSNWTIPAPVADFRMLSASGETPVLSFTAQDDSAEYLLSRTVGGSTREIAVLRGESGQEMRFEDDELDLSRPAEYVLLPRNALLYEQGVLLTGPRTEPLHYEPGGLLNTILSAGADKATPAPPEVESVENQSLFG